jgi:hypothetical protein
LFDNSNLAIILLMDFLISVEKRADTPPKPKETPNYPVFATKHLKMKVFSASGPFTNVYLL